MPGQHLLEQWALEGNVTAQVKWGVSQHLVDHFALLFAHAVLLHGGCSGAVEHRGAEDEVSSHQECDFDAVRTPGGAWRSRLKT
jgi:hypothetical protein